jgi:hypothetical protein
MERAGEPSDGRFGRTVFDRVVLSQSFQKRIISKSKGVTHLFLPCSLLRKGGWVRQGPSFPGVFSENPDETRTAAPTHSTCLRVVVSIVELRLRRSRVTNSGQISKICPGLLFAFLVSALKEDKEK